MKISTEAVWEEGIVPGVDMQFKPITRTMKRVAGKAQSIFMAEAGVITPEEIDTAFKTDLGPQITDAFAISLVQQGLIAWRGLFGADDEPLPLNPDTIAAMLEHPQLGEAVLVFYAAPVLLQEAEKNVSSPASNGTAAGETAAETTAKTAPSARTAPRANGPAGKTARTKSTPRTPTSGKRPGKS